MSNRRQVRLFRNGRNQALRIPRDWELDCEEAVLHRDGDCLVIEPVRKGGLLKLLAGLEPIDEPFPDVDAALPELDEPEL